MAACWNACRIHALDRLARMAKRSCIASPSPFLRGSNPHSFHQSLGQRFRRVLVGGNCWLNSCSIGGKLRCKRRIIEAVGSASAVDRQSCTASRSASKCCGQVDLFGRKSSLDPSPGPLASIQFLWSRSRLASLAPEPPRQPSDCDE